METYDILMLIVLGGTIVYGALKGFAWQLASIGSITISYIVAYRYREPFSQSISAEAPWNLFLAMLILYVGTSLLIWLIFRMVSKTIDRMKLREFDRHVGAAFGAAKGVLYCTLITLFAVTLLGPQRRQQIVQSRSGYYISKVLTHSNGVMPDEVTQVIGPYIERFEAQVESGQADQKKGFEAPWEDLPNGDRRWPQDMDWSPEGDLPPLPSFGSDASSGNTPAAWPLGERPSGEDRRR